MIIKFKKNKKYKKDIIIKNSNHKYLKYTNLLLIFSILYFFQYTKQKPILEYVFVLFLIIIIIFSQLFWNNPIKNSQIHKIDAIIAKISIISFILYTLIYKFRYHCLFIILFGTISFYFSNYYSKQQWCSNNHIFCHGLLHILCFIFTLYTFSQIL